MNFPGGFPVDLVLFGLIAAFLILRLRSILGRRTGFEGRPPQNKPQSKPQSNLPFGLWRGRGGPVRPMRDNEGPNGRRGAIIEGQAEPVPPRPVRPLPDPASPLGEQLKRLRARDAGFDPARFLEAAENTFRSIVTAFAAGDRVTLRALLTDDTYRAFETAIAARETAGETQRTEIREIATVAITAVDLQGSTADVTLRFVSDQVNTTLDKDGKPVAGTEGITEMIDLWTFERDMALRDQTWRLAAARSA
jgi:predicted lipid-binding transport protein (Tim44 family)